MDDSTPNPLNSTNRNLNARFLLYGLAAITGCLVGFLPEKIMPLWMAIKPRPSTVGSPFLGTQFEPLGQWLIFILLYVPDLLLLVFVGFLTGFFVRQRYLVWLSTCVTIYGAFVVFRGGGPWWYALDAFLRGAWRDGFFWGSMAAIILSTPFLSARITFWVRPTHRRPGECKKCGYLLFGLESNTCPECGSPFSRSLPFDSEEIESRKCQLVRCVATEV